jgi:ribonuclease E
VKRDDKRDAVRDERKDVAKPERRDSRRGERVPAQPRPGDATDGRRPRGERRPERPAEPHAIPAEPAGAPLPQELLAEEPIIASPSVATLVTADATTADAGSDERRRRRRRRRGRGAREGAEGAPGSIDGDTEAQACANQSAALEPRANRAEPDVDTAQPTLSTAAVTGNGHDSASPRLPPAPAPAPLAAPPTPVAASGVVVMRTPDLVTIPATVALPAAQPAPLPLDDLQPVLELAGLTLVQTEPTKLQAALAEVASEAPPPRQRRERPRLPPIEEAPLVQVETRRGDSA